jgi:hypothetical protein
MTPPTKDVSAGQRVALGVVGLVQVALAFLAFWDLAQRPASQVRGPKPVWIPVILVNWVGPLTYFYVHRRR